ncbi:hypothetical protein E4U40_001505 [Claviceps sp. LM458 group G5]|nr:hypothetical protein E4U40_001505 [Claviceps sp. LM458 group G5]
MVLMGLDSKDRRNSVMTLSPDCRKCINCGLTKPLQDFKSFRWSRYVLRCITCRCQQQSTTISPGVSGTKREGHWSG